MRMGFMHGPGWGAFSMGGGRRGGGRRLKRGILKFVLLRLLAEEPRHGYDLIRAFREKGWGGGAGSIYPLLGSLEEAGLIEGKDEGERRTYTITEKGRRLLGEHAVDLGEIFEDGDDEEPPERTQRRELRDAASRLMAAVGQLGPSSKPETIEAVRDLLDRTRKDIYGLLAQE